MTIRYVRSTDGNNSDTGLTWALAKATLQGVAAGDAAGDTIYVSHVHSETTATSIFFAWAGTVGTPVKVICANDAAEPPTAAASTANIECTGFAAQIQCSGSVFMYGINFLNNGNGASAHIWLHDGADNPQMWDTCSFQVNSTTAASYLFLNSVSTSTGDIKWKDCTVKFGSTGSAIIPQCDNWLWEGGSVVAGSATPTGLITLSTGRNVNIEIRGVDFSAFDPAFYFIGTNGGCKMVIRNCKLPPAWVGGIYNGTLDVAARVELYNCDSGDTNYKFLMQDPSGGIAESTTIYRTSGATDGFTHYSIAMTSNANCNNTYGEFPSPEISVWNDVVGASVTIAIDIAHDSVTALTNDEVHLQVEYLGDASYTLSTVTDNGPTTPLTTATTPTASTNAWTTTGLANANVQTLSMSVTPEQRGYIHCRVMLKRASYPIYVDPKIQLT